MSEMKLDKWDVGIGIIVGSWVILQILRLLMLYAGFNVWGVDSVLIFYFIVPISSGWIGILFLIGSGIVLLVRAFQKSKSLRGAGVCLQTLGRILETFSCFTAGSGDHHD